MYRNNKLRKKPQFFFLVLLSYCVKFISSITKGIRKRKRTLYHSKMFWPISNIENKIKFPHGSNIDLINDTIYTRINNVKDQVRKYKNPPFLTLNSILPSGSGICFFMLFKLVLPILKKISHFYSYNQHRRQFLLVDDTVFFSNLPAVLL